MSEASVKWSWVAVVLWSVAAIGCATKHEHSGTDSTTHWLAQCESDAQCGALQCLCGVCTASCEAQDSCDRFGERASCVDQACGGGSACELECEDTGDCAELGSSARCSDGRCERAPSSPNDGGTDAGQQSQDASAGDGGASNPCVPMKADHNGDECASSPGFAWNGVACFQIRCGCEGADCDGLFADSVACEAAFRSCGPLTMCTRHSECTLQSVECCGCGPYSRDDVFAMSTFAGEAHAERVCVVGQPCPECELDPFAQVRARYVPTCGTATRWEGGECRLTDLARLPCTEDDGCRVRARTCCECGADTSLENLVSVPAGGLDFELFCEPGTGTTCPECEADYPENVEARCGSTGFCELYEDGQLVPL